MPTDRDALFKTALQIFSILCLIGLMALIFHKGFADLSVVWREHSGGDFWVALARYLLRNLAG
jgi:hypothetical protein